MVGGQKGLPLHLGSVTSPDVDLQGEGSDGEQSERGSGNLFSLSGIWDTSKFRQLQQFIWNTAKTSADVCKDLTDPLLSDLPDAISPHKTKENLAFSKGNSAIHFECSWPWTISNYSGIPPTDWNAAVALTREWVTVISQTHRWPGTSCPSKCSWKHLLIFCPEDSSRKVLKKKSCVFWFICFLVFVLCCFVFLVKMAPVAWYFLFKELCICFFKRM